MLNRRFNLPFLTIMKFFQNGDWMDDHAGQRRLRPVFFLSNPTQPVRLPA
jgi:hypothetical protein